MTVIQASKTTFYKERAIQLAIVTLTRRDDLLLQNPPPDTEVDLLVSLLHNQETTGRSWGVIAKGVPKVSAATSNVTKTHRDISFPVCEFVFAMDTDAGFWRWVQAPAPNETTRLLWNRNTDLFLLDNAAVEKMRQTVNSWYEQRK